MANGDQTPGGFGDDPDTGLSDQAPGGFGEPDVDSGLTDQEPGGFGEVDRGESELTDIAPGETLEQAQERDFSEFAAQTVGLFENIQEALGLGPQVTGAIKRGAEISDPASFSAGRKTGGAFELAGAISSIAGLPTAVGVNIVDRVLSAVSNPAFSVGRATVENRLSAVAGPAGALAGIAGQSANLARAVELGLNLGGAVLAAAPTGLLGDPASATLPAARTGDSEQLAGAEPALPSAPAREQRGAFVTTATEAFERNVAAVLPDEERFSRADLRIGSV